MLCKCITPSTNLCLFSEAGVYYFGFVGLVPQFGISESSVSVRAPNGYSGSEGLDEYRRSLCFSSHYD